MRRVISSRWFEPSVLRHEVGAFPLESLGASITAKRSRQPLFMYAETGRGRDVGAGRFDCEIVTVSPAELVAADQYYYYTAPIRGFSNWEELVSTRGAYCSIWVGSRGSTTQSHYDVADNVLVQSVGRKRVRVWSPGEHGPFHVFPDAHPRARKAQADVDTPTDRFPLRRRLGQPVLDVCLGPGDAVRIPAFWFHHCEALDFSVSFNVFAPSEAALAASSVLGSSVPLFEEDDWKKALSSELAKLLDRDVTGFLRDIDDSRFEPLRAAYERDDESGPPPTFSSKRPRSPPPGYNPKDEEARRSLALGRCLDNAGPAAAPGVQELVLAHLAELWGLAATQGDVLWIQRMLGDRRQATSSS
ncbi:hypothetical protein CTAYLR_007148 [Chrysophaeum taylorii]|uniref:JmjC domain-containing protein n=1 Tax=Chrysophaeum taylorii TaxID=2483200 RepID=A0AAD7UKN2_9STRA|nr:hypothetical protein CTAYLR_007148 [Chrysophaeum taylorii]